MVTFTCSGCGQSMKKAKVDAHVNSCRNCNYVTCIDCSKDFHDDGYQKHTSCITENEKYGAVGTVHKERKGDLKQQDWTQSVINTSEDQNVPQKIRDYLKKLNGYDNIPRKKGKFINFLGNSLRIHNSKLAEEIYNSIPQNKPRVNQNQNGSKLDSIDNNKIENKSNNTNGKNKNGVANSPPSQDINKDQVNTQKELTENGKKFSWNKAMKRILTEAPDNQLPIKKLRKKVLKEYKKSVVNVSQDKTALKEKFSVRLESCKKFVNIDGKVSLSKKPSDK